jgi:hypothetical protein
MLVALGGDCLSGLGGSSMGSIVPKWRGWDNWGTEKHSVLLALPVDLAIIGMGGSVWQKPGLRQWPGKWRCHASARHGFWGTVEALTCETLHWTVAF